MWISWSEIPGSVGMPVFCTIFGHLLRIVLVFCLVLFAEFGVEFKSLSAIISRNFSPTARLFTTDLITVFPSLCIQH